MFDDPTDDPTERAIDPAQRARDKSDEFRMHAELCAVFEGCRKFDARINPTLSAEVARECQKLVARIEKSRLDGAPVISAAAEAKARRALTLNDTAGLATNDYHVYRRPGETMIIRWLTGDEVDRYYQRLQAHFDAALTQFREDERQALGWKQDESIAAYLDALDKVEIKMPDRYLRSIIQTHRVFVLSTHTSDEMDILHLCETIMRISPAEVVGGASAPPEDSPTEQDRAWFFKLFALRGIVENLERMCFFTYLQKTDEAW
jgi:hypothetical protein